MRFSYSENWKIFNLSSHFHLLEDKTGLRIDQPDSSGGTTSTGNVAKKAFSDDSHFIECVLSTIAVEHRFKTTRSTCRNIKDFQFQPVSKYFGFWKAVQRHISLSQGIKGSRTNLLNLN